LKNCRRRDRWASVPCPSQGALLIAPGAGRSLWAWLGGRPPIEAAAARALDRFSPPEGTFLACGDVAFGEQGFVQTHRQALQA